MIATIELKDEGEGKGVATSDFFFDRIGDPMPIEFARGGSARPYGPGCLPSRPLAVSERFELIFVAHSSGFCVARIWSVMELAKRIKEGLRGRSVQQLSVVDVHSSVAARSD